MFGTKWSHSLEVKRTTEKEEREATSLRAALHGEIMNVARVARLREEVLQEFEEGPQGQRMAYSGGGTVPLIMEVPPYPTGVFEAILGRPLGTQTFVSHGRCRAG